MVFGNTYPYNSSLPVRTDYPGKDQPGMQINTSNTAGIFENDHIGFNAENGGTHEQISQAGVQTLGSFTPGMGQSVIYPVLGQTGTNKQVHEVMQNSSCSVPLSCMRAFCAFDVVPPPTPPATYPVAQGAHTSFNVTSINFTSQTVVNIVFATGCINPGAALTGTPAVFIDSNIGPNQSYPQWTWTPGSNTLNINLGAGATAGDTISVLLLQF
jgi:hypothetical protein